jgi:hypothetical protein
MEVMRKQEGRMRNYSDQFLFDIFITACEGGVNYWAAFLKYHWRDKDGSEDLTGFYAKVYDEEDEEEEEFVVNAEVIRKGLNAVQGKDFRVGSGILGNILLGIRNDDASDIDADAADVIIQAGLFNGIVYG